jgi:hypothetical protein
LRSTASGSTAFWMMVPRAPVLTRPTMSISCASSDRREPSSTSGRPSAPPPAPPFFEPRTGFGMM